MRFLFLSLTALLTVHANAQQLAPFKDNMFTHPNTLQRQGSFYKVHYDELRYVNGRDEIPVEKAKDERVFLLNEYEQSTRIAGLSLHYLGSLNSSDFITIFIHGAGGSRDLGFSDWSFGGNFNRLKNLAIRNNGAYISPSISFSNNGMNKVGRLIEYLKRQNSNVKIVLSCASQGGSVCWHLAQSRNYSEMISGMIFLGSAVNMPSTNLPYIQSKKPIVFAHGSLDPVLSWQNLLNSYQAILNTDANYPTQYYLFETGIHGTPIRMIDWRLILNWIL